ncbi:sensor histidine kinase N-terminal domain-containing protein [Leisingera sp.]|uniref:sensor histidine kinase N-terminal domain-containing protein n=1 Tax=Leisingera sp. TaxID=1879318 RepID=UPI003A94645B
MRLFLLILPPLFLVSIVLGIWRFEVAQRTSEDLFDRSLLAAALAISRDVAISEGDALSPQTRRLVSNAGGGEIFYHVTGPGGIYVTGYAYPPRAETPTSPEEPQFFVADYRGEPVRVMRMSETTTIGNLTGETAVTVWQRVADRDAFAAALALRAAALMAGLMLALALVVWFGVQIGLRPLNDLQDAIRRRSPDDLGQIRRPVPKEVIGIVATLNRLFAQVRSSFEAHQAFISDAAHQLRNPASALLSLAETLPEARDPARRQAHEQALIAAARKSARLANQLLSLERLRYEGVRSVKRFDLTALAAQVCRDQGPAVLSRDIDFEFFPSPNPLMVSGDAVLVGEAITNLIENAVTHGGLDMTKITVRTLREGPDAVLLVQDNGAGIPDNQADTAFRRFGQLRSGEGSGLGLSIVQDVMQRHNGSVELLPVSLGTTVRLSFPT